MQPQLLEFYFAFLHHVNFKWVKFLSSLNFALEPFSFIICFSDIVYFPLVVSLAGVLLVGCPRVSMALSDNKAPQFCNCDASFEPVYCLLQEVPRLASLS